MQKKGKMGRHHCQFYEDPTGGYFRFQSTVDANRYITFYKNGKPYRMEAKKLKKECSEFIKVSGRQLMVPPPVLEPPSPAPPPSPIIPKSQQSGRATHHGHNQSPTQQQQEFSSPDIRHHRHQNHHNPQQSQQHKNGRKLKKKPQRTSSQKQMPAVRGRKRPVSSQERVQGMLRQQQHLADLEEQKQRAIQDERAKQQERAEQRQAEFNDEYSNDDNNMISDVDYLSSDRQNNNLRSTELQLKQNHKRHQIQKELLRMKHLKKTIDWNTDSVLLNRLSSPVQSSKSGPRKLGSPSREQQKPNHRHHPGQLGKQNFEEYLNM